MRSARAGWSVAFSTSEAIDAALYARDALGLPVAEEIPPLSPPAEELRPRRTVSVETWSGVWQRALRQAEAEGRGERVLPPRHEDGPLSQLEDAFRRWSTRRQGIVDPATARHAFARMLDDVRVAVRTGHFRLVLTELPVDRPTLVRVGPQHLLVSASALQDPVRREQVVAAARALSSV